MKRLRCLFENATKNRQLRETGNLMILQTQTSKMQNSRKQLSAAAEEQPAVGRDEVLNTRVPDEC